MMKINPIGYLGQMPWIAPGVVALLIGGLWFVRAEHSPWEAIPMVAVPVWTTVAAILWQHRRTRKRWQAALDAYAEREISGQRRSTALRRVRTLSTALGISGSVANQSKPSLTRRRDTPHAERQFQKGKRFTQSKSS
jgi:hypothetical protein